MLKLSNSLKSELKKFKGSKTDYNVNTPISPPYFRMIEFDMMIAIESYLTKSFNSILDFSNDLNVFDNIEMIKFSHVDNYILETIFGSLKNNYFKLTQLFLNSIKFN